MLNPVVETKKKLEEWFTKVETVLIENESVITMVKADMDAKSKGFGTWTEE